MSAPADEVVCLRCPCRVEADDAEFLKWLPMLDEAGNPCGNLCPDCTTDVDRRESSLRFGGQR